MILLDTHVLVWLAADPKRIRRAAASAIRRAQARRGLAVSSASLWELADLTARGRVRIATSPDVWLRRLLERTEVSVREITVETAVTAAYWPPTFPADPFDRLIAATAFVARAPLVTADARIQDSRVVPTIW